MRGHGVPRSGGRPERLGRTGSKRSARSPSKRLQRPLEKHFSQKCICVSLAIRTERSANRRTRRRLSGRGRGCGSGLVAARAR